jgi:hypothetical protein
LVAVAQIRQHGVRPLPLALTKPWADAAVAFQAANQRLTTVMENQRKRDIAYTVKIGDGIVALTFLILALTALAVARAGRNRDTQAMEARLREEHDRAADERVYVEGRRRLSQLLLAANPRGSVPAREVSDRVRRVGFGCRSAQMRQRCRWTGAPHSGPAVLGAGAIAR